MADGDSSYSGRVEIYRNGEWGTVCDDYWTDRTAQVVCQQLGFGSRSASVDFGVPAGTGPILMDDVNCSNGQTNLLACSHNGFGNHNCSHMEDVGVSCSRPPSGTYVASMQILIKHVYNCLCHNNYDTVYVHGYTAVANTAWQLSTVPVYHLLCIIAALHE